MLPPALSESVELRAPPLRDDGIFLAHWCRAEIRTCDLVGEMRLYEAVHACVVRNLGQELGKPLSLIRSALWAMTTVRRRRA